jgi:cytochrome c peroxidase
MVKTPVLFTSILAASALLGVTSTRVLAQTTEIQLGEVLYFDKNLSLNKNQACSSCHDPDFGFVDPDNVQNGTPVSDGSITDKTGSLNAPSAAYAAFSPFFHWDGDEGLYVGGQFWNGRANTLAAQAAGPFLNPVEMTMPDKWSVVDQLRASASPNYQAMFSDVYDVDLSAIAPYTGDYESPVEEAKFPPGILEVYDRMAKAIGEFEKTEQFTKFDSKFDYYLAGEAELTKSEKKGLKLFNGKGKCNLCHLSEPTLAPDGFSEIPPLFTDFTYDNLGVPQNVNIPDQPIDPGLGGRPDIAAKDTDGLQIGKHKVMSLRNIALTPPYAHNGVFATLEQIVHFYNTRDALPNVCADNNDEGFGETCWPAPEVPQNVNTDELGDLKLTDAQEADIVAFLKTLSDGWGPANGMEPLPPPPLPPFP